MNGNKLGKFIIMGAMVGAAVSMFDRSTRRQVSERSRGLAKEIRFYSRNQDILRWKLQEKKEKYQSVYEQLAGDVTYIKKQIEELKALTPQVKELVVDTKDAFVESKDEYKSIASDTPVQKDIEEIK
jgi:TRAP-type mannitol/chloroaromatic compound transport system substrate-binding protein